MAATATWACARRTVSTCAPARASARWWSFPRDRTAAGTLREIRTSAMSIWRRTGWPRPSRSWQTGATSTSFTAWGSKMRRSSTWSRCSATKRWPPKAARGCSSNRHSTCYAPSSYAVIQASPRSPTRPRGGAGSPTGRSSASPHTCEAWWNRRSASTSLRHSSTSAASISAPRSRKRPGAIPTRR